MAIRKLGSSSPKQDTSPEFVSRQRSPTTSPPQRGAISIPPGGTTRSPSGRNYQNGRPNVQNSDFRAGRKSQYAPGASPPLPPIPRNRSLEGPGDFRAPMFDSNNTRRGSDDTLPPLASFGPAFEVPDMDGLGLGFDQEVILDPQSPIPMPSPSQMGYDSEASTPTLSSSTLTTPTFTPPTFAQAPPPAVTAAPKRISFMRKQHPGTVRNNSNESYTGSLEQAASTAAALEENLEVELSPLPQQSRERVAVLRKRGSVSAASSNQNSSSSLAVPQERKKANKRHTVDGSSPSGFHLSRMNPIRMEPVIMEAGPTTYKPLPSADAYCIRPSVTMETQTPDWEVEYAPDPPTPTPIPGAPTRWLDDTPPQAYAAFPVKEIASPPPPPPPAHSPKYHPPSPSIYSVASHDTRGQFPDQSRRSSYYASNSSNFYEDNFTRLQNGRIGSALRPQTPSPKIIPEPSFARVPSSPTPHLPAVPEFRPTSRSSLPTDSTTIEERPQPKARPVSVFNPGYQPYLPPEPKKLEPVVDYDVPYLQPEATYQGGPSRLSAAYEPAPPSSLAPPSPSAPSLAPSSPGAQQSSTAFTTPLGTPNLTPNLYSAPAFAIANPFSAPSLSSPAVATSNEMIPPHSPHPTGRRSPRPQSSPVPPRSPAVATWTPSTPPTKSSNSFHHDSSSPASFPSPAPPALDAPSSSIGKASVISSHSSFDIRRASIVRVSPPSSRPVSFVMARKNSTSSNASSKRGKEDEDAIPRVPNIPLELRKSSLPNHLDEALPRRRQSESDSIAPAVARVGGVSRAERAEKGRSYFLVQALNNKAPQDIMKSHFAREAEDEDGSDSELSSEDEFGGV